MDLLTTAVARALSTEGSMMDLRAKGLVSRDAVVFAFRPCAAEIAACPIARTLQFLSASVHRLMVRFVY